MKITQRGFTLIELLVVVSILAAMATISVSVIGGYDQRARAELVNVEMKNIANAIYRFQQDTGYFPKEGLFSVTAPAYTSDFEFLFASPRDAASTEILPWNAAIGRGWNGPYLTTDSRQRLIAPNTECDLDVVTITNSVAGLEDPFQQKLTLVNTDDCFAVRSSAGDWTPKDYAGRAYRYETAFAHPSAYPNCTSGTNTCIALVSAGPDGNFGDTNNDGVYGDNSADNDDIVRILRVNP